MLHSLSSTFQNLLLTRTSLEMARLAPLTLFKHEKIIFYNWFVFSAFFSKIHQNFKIALKVNPWLPSKNAILKGLSEGWGHRQFHVSKVATIVGDS